MANLELLDKIKYYNINLNEDGTLKIEYSTRKEHIIINLLTQTFIRQLRCFANYIQKKLILN